MTEKEFNLSDYICRADEEVKDKKVIEVLKIKESVRRLKKEMPYFGYNADVNNNKHFVNIDQIIKKIFGEKLI